MTRKDYESAVRLIRKAAVDSNDDPYLISNLTLTFAEFFQNDNPRFDRERFVDAAYGQTGIRGGKVKR